MARAEARDIARSTLCSSWGKVRAAGFEQCEFDAGIRILSIPPRRRPYEPGRELPRAVLPKTDLCP
jgi:hypothetical protein